MAMISACLELKLQYSRKKAADADWDQVMPHKLLSRFCLSTFWGSQFYSQTNCSLLEEFSAVSPLSLLSFRLSILPVWVLLPDDACLGPHPLTVSWFINSVVQNWSVQPSLGPEGASLTSILESYCLFVSKVICDLTFLFGPTPSPVGRNRSQGDCYSLKLSLRCWPLSVISDQKQQGFWLIFSNIPS